MDIIQRAGINVLEYNDGGWQCPRPRASPERHRADQCINGECCIGVVPRAWRAYRHPAAYGVIWFDTIGQPMVQIHYNRYPLTWGNLPPQIYYPMIQTSQRAPVNTATTRWFGRRPLLIKTIC